MCGKESVWLERALFQLQASRQAAQVLSNMLDLFSANWLGVARKEQTKRLRLVGGCHFS